ncbi:BLUF domain-containing protein [Aquimarina sp. D1M17]|uniref:BLUF domain-containing protein n=1 Tax=Aquimarina acroporae TaxID=2937283 RepID=UPI0020BDB7D3|nr:BLUF domain-containing protein [Aquimarina acroporae]MCK8522202.1 BLUF domain-containing protein [Aquimarina acroporae]
MRYVISYVSTINPQVSDMNVTELMDHVKHRNTDLEITGILIYSEGNFFQVLEGEKDIIHSIFNKIKNDTRHYNIIKILDKEIEDHSFSKYHSSFTVISNHYSHRELQLFLEQQKKDNPEHFQSISYLTQKFMKLS